ncbi:hypothetical protein GCM10025868_45980 [Angustibacter aerolatus]|nr:hypothetical protein GCM10025868_45980 [Angustibacter aerolatus]
MAGYVEAMTCDKGDFTEYAALRRAISEREAEPVARSPARAPGRGGGQPRGAAPR